MNRILCAVLLATPLLAQSPIRTTRHLGTVPFNGPAGAVVGDLDGDGDLDLLVSADYGTMQLLFNDGQGRFVDVTMGRLISPPAIQRDNHANSLADIDGDGDLDILMGNEDHLPNRVYTNNGSGVFTDVSTTALPANAFDTKNHVVADFDGDGDVDWLCVDYGGSHLYFNNGAGVFTDVSATNLQGVSPSLGNEWIPNAPAADLDGDGDLDVLMFGAGGLLRNQNGVLSPFATQLPANARNAPHWLVDVDGDGDIDLFAGAGRYLFRNAGNATFTDVTQTAFGAQPTGGLACFDVDGDGDADLLTATAVWYNDGAGSFAALAGTAPFVNAWFCQIPGDYDGDGDLELPGTANFHFQLDAPTPPTIGNPYAVGLHSRLGSLAATLAAFGPGSVPFGPYGTFLLDPATMVTVDLAVVVSSPHVRTWTLPNVPALVGTALHYQAIVDDGLRGPVIGNTFRDVVQ